MSQVCLYFQVHQPFRLRQLSVIGEPSRGNYFNDELNREIITRVAETCYIPANRALLEAIVQNKGAFKVSFSITGTALEQMALYAPAALESFKALARTGCVEFLGETATHSLASLYDIEEFKQQVQLHSDLVEHLFGMEPTVFRNTELIHFDAVGQIVEELGFKGMLAEGADSILGELSPNAVYSVPKTELGLLVRNHLLSDDIAFRFSNTTWPGYPLTADTYAAWLHSLGSNTSTVNLFLDYETFGEHQKADTGIFEFLRNLPAAVLKDENWKFSTPSEVIAHAKALKPLSFPRITSWADVERDVRAWTGNKMQNKALNSIYELKRAVYQTGNPLLVATWRKLLTSDHFYYMSTKGYPDQEVHAYFRPYESPYEAFMNYMTAVSDFKLLISRPLNSHLQFKAELENNVSALSVALAAGIRAPERAQ